VVLDNRFEQRVEIPMDRLAKSRDIESLEVLAEGAADGRFEGSEEIG
jgi:hypothetical protein